MSAKIEVIEKSLVKIEIEVEQDQFEEGMEKSYRKNMKNFHVAGFRKGKVPRNVVVRNYGEEVLYEDAVGFVYPVAYQKAVEENNLHPVDYPKIDIVQIGKGKNFIFTAEVTLKPEVELEQYKGLEIEKVEAIVTDEEVNAEIEKEQNRNARITKVEEGVSKMGDICVIDFAGYLDGVAFEGGAGNDYSLTLGSNSFISGFEEQLVGKEVGQDVEVNVTFPDEYHKEELAGKPAVFNVKIKEIKEKNLPELDDEFAQDISEFDTFEAYKNSIHEKLKAKAEEEAQLQFEDKLLKKVTELAILDVPTCMVESRIDSLIRELDRNLKYQGLDLKRYLQLIGKDYLSLRKSYEPQALDGVKVGLVLDKISKVEEITVSDEDFEKELHEMAEKYGDTYENFKKYLGENELEGLRENLLFKKTMKLLVDNAKLI